MPSLDKLVTIRPGLSFRGRIEDDPAGSLRVLQPSDLDEQGQFSVERLPRTRNQRRSKQPARLTSDTVLVVAYGTRNEAYYFPQPPAGVVPSATFYLLTPKPGTALDPRFLYWWLLSPRARAHIDAHRAGSTAQIIRRDALGLLPVPEVPIEMQRHIGAAAREAIEARRHEMALAELRFDRVDATLHACIESLSMV